MRRTIFFDLGWTLENENGSQLDRAKKAVKCCGNLGISTSADRIIELQDEGGKMGIPKVFKYALVNIGVPETELPNIIKSAKWDPSYLVMYDDTVEVLELLSRSNSLGIIANQSQPVGERLKAYGIYGYFKTVLSSCDVGYEKPNLKIFQLAQSHIDSSPDEIWMVGDRIDNDIVPAKRMGWKTIRILQGSHRMQEPGSEIEMADHTVRRLSEIPAIVR